MLRERIITLAAALIVCLPLTRVAADEVSHQPPAIYKEKLAALLTPLEEVLRSKAEPEPADTVGVTLLLEQIDYIDAKGRRCIVYHHINKALNDAGAKELEDATWDYRKATQTIHLVLAQTISPDGRRIPVQPGATILQTPQRQADYSLYDDKGEMRLIFPNVKAGSIIETIVVIDESRSRIPGEFTAGINWAFGWAVKKTHYVIEMPSKLAGRLKVTPIGEGVPDPETTQPSKDRVRFVWNGENIAALPNEAGCPPTLQVGPAYWLTTLPDWDAFVKWYAPLLEKGSTLKPSLAKQIDEWTANAHSPAETLDILMAKIAKDVRYVGLEFGNADLQPHDCNVVWENQYGDCKDKANLLRTMLQHKGINASLALVNTENVGRIERRSPDFRQFNHAIAAVELQPGNLVFCDPTIVYAKAGMLAPGDTDRDVLLIKNGGAKWTHTPAQEAGTLDYNFDLKLAADGELSGWLNQEISGYYGLSWAEDCSHLDKNGIRSKAHDIVQAFFKGAEVVDVTNKWDGRYHLKAYFLVPGADHEGLAKQSLAFPQADLLFSDPGADKKRKTSYYIYSDTVQMNARIMLPEGISPASLPHPYKLESPVLDGVAQWNVNGRECRATLQVHTKKSCVPAEQFEIFHNSLLSIRAWLDNPLSLRSTGTAAEPPPEKSFNLENFPMMASGEGQIDLVERRFPENGDQAARREALRKTIQYFPFDKSTLFTAGIKLTVTGYDNAKALEGANEIRQLLKTYRGSVTAEEFAWGEYMLGRLVWNGNKDDEAEKIFERLGANGELSAYRRSWARYYQAKVLEPKSRDRAIKALREGLCLDAEAKPDTFAFLAKLLIADGRIADLKKEIKQMVAKKPPQYAEMLTRLAESAGDLLPEKQRPERDQLIGILSDAGKSAEISKRYNDALRAFRDRTNGQPDQAATAEAQGKQLSLAVERWLKERKPAWFDFAEPKTLDDPRLSDLDAVLKNPGGYFQTPEVVKLLMLVATSPKQPYERREQAFIDSLDWLMDLARSKDEARSVFDPVVDDQQWPERVRGESLWRAILNAHFEEDAALFEKLRTHPLAANLNDRTKATIELFHDALAVDTTSADAINAFCRHLLEKELTNSGVREFRRFYDRLIQLDPGRAQGIYNLLAGVKFDSNVEIVKASFQMDCLKLLNRAKKWQPAVKAMRQVVFAQFPPEAIQKPAAYATLHDPRNLGLCDENAATQIRLFQIKSGQCDLAYSGFWGDLMRDLNRTEPYERMGIKLVDVALQNLTDDADKASVIARWEQMIDGDNPASRTVIARLFKPFRNAEKFPISYSAIRGHEIDIARRVGEPMDMESAFSNLSSIDRGFVNTTKLGYYIELGNLTLLKKTLDSMSPDELLAGSALPLSLRAFELMGMTDELALAKEAANKALYRSLLGSWTTLDASDCYLVYRLANALHDPSCIPPTWFSDLSVKIPNRCRNLTFRADDAFLREDWPRLLTTADEAIPLYSKYYHFYWFKGAALYHLGKSKEAIEPLKTYVQYSKDELEYPEADAWLKKLDSPSK